MKHTNQQFSKSTSPGFLATTTYLGIKLAVAVLCIWVAMEGINYFFY